MSLLNEVFRNYLFYSKKITPDISLASFEDVEDWKVELIAFKQFLSDHYPMLYSAWCQRSQVSLAFPSEKEEKKEEIELRLCFNTFLTPDIRSN